jgi:hypothetical protein
MFFETKVFNHGNKTSYTIMCDGWTNINSRPLLNILVISPKGSFRKAINTIGKEKAS